MYLVLQKALTNRVHSKCDINFSGDLSAKDPQPKVFWKTLYSSKQNNETLVYATLIPWISTMILK